MILLKVNDMTLTLWLSELFWNGFGLFVFVRTCFLNKKSFETLTEPTPTSWTFEGYLNFTFWSYLSSIEKQYFWNFKNLWNRLKIRWYFITQNFHIVSQRKLISTQNILIFFSKLTILKYLLNEARFFKSVFLHCITYQLVYKKMKT